MMKLLFLIPILQLGFGRWTNVSVLGSLLIVLTMRNQKRILTNFLSPLLILTIFMMYITYIFHDFGNLHAFLRVSRECLVLILCVFYLPSIPPSYLPNLENRFHRVIAFITIFEFFLVCIQFMLIRLGVWFGPDKEWFSLGAESIPEIRDLQYSNIRPSGTFSEPSYLGLVSISFMALTGFSKKPISRWVFLLNFLTIILCQSRSALFYSGALFIIYILRNKNQEKFYLRGFLFPFVLLIGIGSFRLLSEIVLSVKDSVSIDNRVYKPLGSIVTFLVSNPLGVPFYDRINEFQDLNEGTTWAMISHNSVFNFCFSYGFVGVLIVVQILLLAKRDSVLIVILFASLMQNGSFLDFDKFLLLFLVFKIYTYTVGSEPTRREGG